MQKILDISSISDWEDLDDYDKAQLVAEVRKKGGQITGLDPKEVKQLSLLGGYPDLPETTQSVYQRGKQNEVVNTGMSASPIPALTQYGSSFVGGAVPGAKAGAVIGGLPGAAIGAAGGGVLSAGLDFLVDKVTDRKPVAADAGNIVNAASGLIPGGKGIMRGMLRSGTEAATTSQLNNLAGGQQSNPLTAALTGAALSGGLNLATKPLGERARKVADEKDLAQTVQGMNHSQPSIKVGEYAKELLRTTEGEVIDGKPRATVLREIRERTGFDPVALTGDDIKFLKKVENKGDDVYQEILAPIFAAKRTEDLPSAAQMVKQGINSLASVSGRNREEFAKGLRRVFVENAMGDDTDVMTRPDSFRLRLQALGPDTVNELFSSSGKKGERSGAYHALMNLAEAASNENGPLKVIISKKGIAMIENIPYAGKFLAQHARAKELDTEGTFDLDSRIRGLLTAGGVSFWNPGAAKGIVAAGAAREVPRAIYFGWEKAIERFAARSNRASDIIRLLATGEQRFSRAMINNFVKSLATDADKSFGFNN